MFYIRDSIRSKLLQVTGSQFEVGPDFRLQTLLEIGMVEKKEVRMALTVSSTAARGARFSHA